MPKKAKKPARKEPAATERLHLPSFADLIDQLTIDQIKEVLKPQNKQAYAREMRNIMHDIDALIGETEIKMSARTLRIAIAIAQMNLHIWHQKDRMQEDPKRYNH